MTAFDSAALRAALDPAIAAVLDVEAVERIDSTNSELLRRATELPDRLALVARIQDAGRGRRGRAWAQGEDNLALSLFARLPLPPSALGGLSLTLGVACAQALRAQGAGEVGVKWPNDLLARDRKLGGLLVELARPTPHGCEAVIGLGLNLRLPADADADWIALADLAVPGDRLFWAARMIEALCRAVDRFVADGFAAFVASWRALDALDGRSVRVIEAGGEWIGTACGVDADGALRVRAADGERRLHSADVSLRPA
ncbi:MAG: biotin--[acetyl-CoA-carboxylase] ligase [Lysobacteraceae bacterium]